MTADNFDALFEFVSRWRSEPGFEIAPSGDASFSAFVSYKVGSKSTNDNSTVRIVRNGFNEGEISIAETSKLHSDQFHLGFTAKFQQYAFDPDSGKLIVSGKSPKLSAYIVEISPTS